MSWRDFENGMVVVGLVGLFVLASGPAAAEELPEEHETRLSREDWTARVEAARQRIEQMRHEHKSFVTVEETPVDEAEDASKDERSKLPAIRIKSAIRSDYSLDTLFWIDRLAFNAEVIRFRLQHKRVTAGGQFQRRVCTVEFVHFGIVLDGRYPKRERDISHHPGVVSRFLAGDTRRELAIDLGDDPNIGVVRDS